jgi:PPOX class probable F420-dependent enzyme
MQKDKQSIEIIDSPPPQSSSSSSDSSSSFDSGNAANVNVLTEEAGASTLSKEDVSKLFEGRNLAFISTLSKDGSPHITPVWADIENDIIVINTSEAAAKNKHIARDPRVAISIVEQFNPYNMVSIKGKVIEQTTEGAEEHLKKLAKKYLGVGKYYYRRPRHKRVILKIRAEKIMGLSLHPAFYFLAYSPWHSTKEK